jgi:hypothetical protein
MHAAHIPVRVRVQPDLHGIVCNNNIIMMQKKNRIGYRLIYCINFPTYFAVHYTLWVYPRVARIWICAASHRSIAFFTTFVELQIANIIE